MQIQQKFGRGVSDNRVDRRKTDATYVRNSVSQPYKNPLPHLNEETDNNKVEHWLSTNNNEVDPQILNKD